MKDRWKIANVSFFLYLILTQHKQCFSWNPSLYIRTLEGKKLAMKHKKVDWWVFEQVIHDSRECVYPNWDKRKIHKYFVGFLWQIYGFLSHFCFSNRFRLNFSHLYESTRINVFVCSVYCTYSDDWVIMDKDDTLLLFLHIFEKGLLAAISAYCGQSLPFVIRLLSMPTVINTRLRTKHTHLYTCIIQRKYFQP